MKNTANHRIVTIIILSMILALSAGYSSAQELSRTTSATTERVSIASDGTQGDDLSIGHSISAGGRYVAFVSVATNLVDGDTNGYADVFVHDSHLGTTTRVSVASDGTQGNEESLSHSISSDGRYMAFESWATNLVDGDTNGAYDVFLHDRQTGATTRISVASDGTQGNDRSTSPSISGDGHYIAFASSATNLVEGDSNGAWDVFVHDRQTGATMRVSLASNGTQGNDRSSSPSISTDGRYVAFNSMAANLVDGDSNGFEDVFVHDRQTGVTTRVSVASDGTQGDSISVLPSISAHGRYVAFCSWTSNLVDSDSNGFVDVFVHDRQTGATTRVSVASDGTQGNHESYVSSISTDGRFVAFYSDASNLVDSDTNGYYDVFMHDRQTEATIRVSIANHGTQGDDNSWTPSISADGRYVAFVSDATNLVYGDTNGAGDVFLHDRQGLIELSYLPITIR